MQWISSSTLTKPWALSPQFGPQMDVVHNAKIPFALSTAPTARCV